MYNKEYQKEYVLKNKEKNKEYFKEYYLKNKEKIAEQARAYRLNNKDNIKEYKKEHYLNNKDNIKEYKKEYYLKNKDNINEKNRKNGKEYRLKNRKNLNEKNKIYRLNKKIEVYNHYCNGDVKCQKCGETNIKCLSIDHINGGGRKHRKEICGALTNWLIKNNYPEGFQILCINCQFIKRIENKEYAKHEEQTKIAHKISIRRLNQKTKVYNHYCNGDIKCKKCGKNDLRYLSIDHINGGGRKHRKEIGAYLPAWLIKNNFPEGYQILCMNCQFKKRVENNECCAIDAIRK